MFEVSLAPFVACASLLCLLNPGINCEIDAGGATSRILGPEVNPPHSQPWVVGMIFNNGDQIECGGTLISKKHVISAAHCVWSVDFFGFNRIDDATHVIVGEHDQRIADGEERIPITKETMHPDYHPSLHPNSDLIVYELAKMVENRYAKPAYLPEENEEFAKYIVSGWGYKNKNQESSDVLRSVVIADIRTDDSCYSLREYYDPNNTLCGEKLSNIWEGPCGGDSGGPWVSKNEKGDVILAGVHKAGDCAMDEVPHVAVQVSHAPFLKWIKDVTGIN